MVYRKHKPQLEQSGWGFLSSSGKDNIVNTNKRKLATARSIDYSRIKKADFDHYVSLIGLDATITLLTGRAKSAAKLEHLRAKNQTEQLASSRPDGRLNGYNMSLGSLVCKMGGKRKAKKTKRGY